MALGGLGLIVGTPLMPFYLRLMGAKVGRDCALDSALDRRLGSVLRSATTPAIGADTQYGGMRVENGWLIVGRVDIGSRCFVGGHSAIGLNVRMEDDSRARRPVAAADGETIPAGQRWRGSPAQPGEVAVPAGVPIRYGMGRKIWFCVATTLMTHPARLALRAALLACRDPARLDLGVQQRLAHRCLVASAVAHAVSRRDRLPVGRVVQGDHHAPRNARHLRALFDALLRHWLSYGLMRVNARRVPAAVHDRSTCRRSCGFSAPSSGATPRCRRCGASCPRCLRPATACSSPTAV